MAYGRYKRRRFTKRGGRRAYRRRTRKLGGRVKRVERRVQRLASGIETKCYQFSYSGAKVSSQENQVGPDYNVISGAADFWQGMDQGVGGGEKVGNSIKVTSATFGYLLAAVPDMTTMTVTTRILVVKWKKIPPGVNIGTTPSITYVLENPNQYYAIFSPYNWMNRKYYKVIYDKQLKLTRSAEYVSGTSVPTPYFNGQVSHYRIVNFKFKGGLKTIYASSGDNNITSNGLACYIVGDNTYSPLGGSYPTFNWYVRVKYQDS